MQLSQSFSFGKSSYFKGVCASLVIAGVSGSIIFNRLEPLLIPLGIALFVAGKQYFDSKNEKETLYSRINTLESELVYYLKFEQQHKFVVLDLQENNKLKEASRQDKKLIQRLKQKITSLQNSLVTVEKSIQYYESEIVNENYTLNAENKSLKHTVEELQLQQELLQEECELLQQKKANILSELTQYQLKKQLSETEIEVKSIDLSDRKLAIVGGYPKVQDAIIDDLKQEYNLREGIKFTSNDRERRITQQHIKDRFFYFLTKVERSHYVTAL
ncbi:MAG: hypothetical protein AAF383_19735 [Cyanobacteria bacterium P01_A01_bin.83]